MPSAPTYEEVMAAPIEELDAIIHARFSTGTASYMSTVESLSSYEWYWWRFAPNYRWRLRNLVDPDANPPPYSIPVLCDKLAKEIESDRGLTETVLSFFRRGVIALLGLTPIE